MKSWQNGMSAYAILYIYIFTIFFNICIQEVKGGLCGISLPFTQ